MQCLDNCENSKFTYIFGFDSLPQNREFIGIDSRPRC